MRISCIIPTCNRPDLLLEALASVKRQSRPPDEIIVVNSGNQDIPLPPELAESVRVYAIIPFCGASQTRNFGASVATGDALAFLDDDDMWTPDYLHDVEQALQDGATCVISALHLVRRGSIAPYKTAPQPLRVNDLLIANPGVIGSNIVIAKDVFYRVGGFDSTLITSEDKSLVIEILLSGATVSCLPDTICLFRDHDGVRLSNNNKMTLGIARFTQKYGHLMTAEQYAYNRLKIKKTSYEGGRTRSIFGFAFWKIAYTITHLLHV